MDVRNILQRYGIRPSRRRGEYFLIDQEILKREVSYADITKQDTVLEIGAGIGNLTEILVAQAKKVIAVEKNRVFCQILRAQNFRNVEIIEGDALEVKFPSFNKIVSNLPYFISSKITFKLLDYDWDLAVLSYQREFAERLVAKVGSRNYSRLSVAINYYCNVELLETIKRNVFYPRPDVDSIIVRLKKKKPEFKVNDFFWLVLRACFQHKRKKVKNALFDSAHIINIKKEKLRKDLRTPLFQRKVMECSLEDFRQIADMLTSLID